MTDRHQPVSRYAPLLFGLLLLDWLAVAAWTDDLLSQLERQVSAGAYGEIDGLLLWHDGLLLIENYYNDYNADRLHKVYSTTKSVTSALVGIAIDSGAIDGVEGKMLDFFPNYAPANMDARKGAITLGDMLEMQAGFRWDELSIPYSSPGNSLSEAGQSGLPWMEYVLDVEMSAAPGDEFAYNSLVSLVFSRVLSESVGTSARAYAEENLFTDLGIRRFRWENTPQGDTNTGWGLWLSPQDMLRFGQLYLNDGYWKPAGQLEGKQVISSQWVAESTQPYVDEGIRGRATMPPLNYGYQWWLFQDDAEEVSNLALNDVYFSWGYGGQFIFVVPHLDLIVVSTGQNFGDSERFFSALPDFIFPAIQQIDDGGSWTLSRGASAVYTVIDNDSDSILDDQGDAFTDASGKPRRSVGEHDTLTGNSIARLVAKFDLPSGPSAGRRLVSATLRLFLEDIVGTPASSVSLLHSLSDTIDPFLFPDAASDYQDASYTDTLLDLVGPADESGRYYELDVTDLVLADYAADGDDPVSAFRLQINELVFVDDNEGGKYRFTMPGAAANFPELVLTFIPEPPTILLTAIAVLGLVVCGWNPRRPQ